MTDEIPFELFVKLDKVGFTRRSTYCVPKLDEALKWLRDEKNIHIEIYTCASGYDYIISNTPKLGGSDRHWSESEGPNDGGCWDFYEQAVIAGIEHVLDEELIEL